MTQNLVRNIWAVGRNYAAHANELNNPIPQSPLFFLKAGSCIETGSKITLPKWSKDVHHELEIAFWIDENRRFTHLTLALDLTARDAQNEAKSKGQPWTLAKSFSGACALGPWIALSEVNTFENLDFQLFKNKKLAQSGQSREMLFKPQSLLDYALEHFPVVPYDVLLTGTPAGVGPLVSGDQLEAFLSFDGHKLLTCLWDVE